jgi:hypothetical protein
MWITLVTLVMNALAPVGQQAFQRVPVHVYTWGTAVIYYAWATLFEIRWRQLIITLLFPHPCWLSFSLWSLDSRRRMSSSIFCSISALMYLKSGSVSFLEMLEGSASCVFLITQGMEWHIQFSINLLLPWLYDCLRWLACFAKDGHASLVYNPFSGFFTYFFSRGEVAGYAQPPN